jgi:tetratricopeptide (TPR) repeat protein
MPNMPPERCKDALDKATRRAEEDGVHALERCTALVVVCLLLYGAEELVKLHESLDRLAQLHNGVAQRLRAQLSLPAPVAPAPSAFSETDVAALVAPYVLMITHQLRDSVESYWRIWSDAKNSATLRHSALIGAYATAVKANSALPAPPLPTSIDEIMKACEDAMGDMGGEHAAAFSTIHAKRLLKSSDNEEQCLNVAREWLVEANEKRPNNIGTLMQLAKCALRMGTALKEKAKLARRNSEYRDSKEFNRARIASIEEGVKYLDSAQRRFAGMPVHGEVYLQLAQAHFDLKQYSQARKFHEKLIDVSEQHYHGRRAFYQFKMASFLLYAGMSTEWDSWVPLEVEQHARQGLRRLDDDGGVDQGTELKLHAVLVRLFSWVVKGRETDRRKHAWHFIRLSATLPAQAQQPKDVEFCVELLREHLSAVVTKARVAREPVDTFDGSDPADAWAGERALCELAICERVRFAQDDYIAHVQNSLLGMVNAVSASRLGLCDVARMVMMCAADLRARLISPLPPALQSNINELIDARTKVLQFGELHRAEYACSRDDFSNRGLVAKDPSDTLYSALDHINDGDLKTRYISFTSTPAVAATYWMSAWRHSVPENRMLLTLDPSHPRFRVFEVVEREDVAHGQAQGRVATDREVVIHGHFPACCVEREYNAKAAYEQDELFRGVVNRVPLDKKAQFAKAATHLHDLPLMDTLRRFAREKPY